MVLGAVASGSGPDGAVFGVIVASGSGPDVDALPPSPSEPAPSQCGGAAEERVSGGSRDEEGRTKMKFMYHCYDTGNIGRAIRHIIDDFQVREDEHDARPHHVRCNCLPKGHPIFERLWKLSQRLANIAEKLDNLIEEAF